PLTLGVSLVIDPNLHHWSASYDSNGNRTSWGDDVHPQTVATYNAFGEPTTITDAMNVPTTLTYDSAGNLLSRSTPLLDGQGGPSRTTYNSFERGNTHAGEVTSIVDPLGQPWLLDYDATGDLAAVTDPLGHKATYFYDGVGRQTSQVSPRGNVAGGTPSQYTT